MISLVLHFEHTAQRFVWKSWHVQTQFVSEWPLMSSFTALDQNHSFYQECNRNLHFTYWKQTRKHIFLCHVRQVDYRVTCLSSLPSSPQASPIPCWLGPQSSSWTPGLQPPLPGSELEPSSTSTHGAQLGLPKRAAPAKPKEDGATCTASSAFAVRSI